MTILALIPARGGSRRIPKKNTRLLNGHPLLAYSIGAAQRSGIFTGVLVCTDDDDTADLAEQYGASVHRRREASSTEPDVAWLHPLMCQRKEDCYAILRPTSPFRTAETITRAWQRFQDQQPCDSLRAVEEVKQHPGKMWVCQTDQLPAAASSNPAIGSAHVRQRLIPLLPFSAQWHEQPWMQPFTVPWHSSPTQSLPALYVQNASLEIAWRYCAAQPALAVANTYSDHATIAGVSVCPFFTVGYEGFDLNTADDWHRAEALAAFLPVLDPPVPVAALQETAPAQS